jgi:diacylglycerol O-acyltransferase/trehalose O-mycolyltransferase
MRGMNDHRRVVPTLAAVLVALAASALPIHARAEVVTGPCSALTDPNNAPILDSRLDHLVVGGVHVNVLVPPHYRDCGRRYPVVYLFHGAFSDEDSFTTQTDLIAFTSQLGDDEQAIAVMPSGGYLPVGVDYADGTQHQEDFVFGTLIPFIDATYRTRADRGHRATAGFSAGGLDAMIYAARHPDLFAAAGSFSGFVDPFEPVGQQVAQLFAADDDQLCGGTVSWESFWGDPALHPMGWVGHDPTYLARSLSGMSLYIGSDNGVPCPDNPNPDPFLVFAEQTVYGMSQAFDLALTAAGVAHTTDFQSCGVHLFSNANHDLRVFWPQMLAAFGDRGGQRSFPYRTSEASASAWDWTFAADPARATEFLDVSGASASGLEVTGSGTESVLTGALFRRHQWVAVAGAGSAPQTVRADDAGRIAFGVDLGPAHTLEEYTAGEQAAAAANPAYFVTRTVSFTPLGDSDARELP